MGLSFEEQETIIRWDRSEQKAYVYASDRTTITKMDRLCKEHPENYKCAKVSRAADTHEIVDKRYEIADKSLVSFKGAKRTLNLTEEQRSAISERLNRRSFNSEPSTDL